MEEIRYKDFLHGYLHKNKIPHDDRYFVFRKPENYGPVLTVDSKKLCWN